MARGMEPDGLYVESPNDQFSIIHLLKRHGVSFDVGHRSVNVNSQKNDRGVLDSMAIAIKAGSGRTVGFVIDADDSLVNRWKQIADRLRPLGTDLPDLPPADGFIGESREYHVRVGVWIMPDNATDGGRLENMLETLVPNADPIYTHAQRATVEAKEKGAKFSERDTIKAVLQAWLAWQEQPGHPYGIAIESKYFPVFRRL